MAELTANRTPKCRISQVEGIMSRVACIVENNVYQSLNDFGVYSARKLPNQGGAVLFIGDSGAGKTSEANYVASKWRAVTEELNPQELIDSVGVPFVVDNTYFFCGGKIIPENEVAQTKDGTLIHRHTKEPVEARVEKELIRPPRAELSRKMMFREATDKMAVLVVNEVSVGKPLAVDAGFLMNVQNRRVAQVDCGRRLLWVLTANYADETPGHRPLMPSWMGRVFAFNMQRPDGEDRAAYRERGRRDHKRGGIEEFDIRVNQDKVADKWWDDGHWEEIELRKDAVLEARPDLAYEDEVKADDLNSQDRKVNVLARALTTCKILGDDIMSNDWDPASGRYDYPMLLAQGLLGIQKGTAFITEFRRGDGVSIRRVLDGSEPFVPTRDRLDTAYFVIHGCKGQVLSMDEGPELEKAKDIMTNLINAACRENLIALIKSPCRELSSAGRLNLRNLSDEAKAGVRKITRAGV